MIRRIRARLAARHTVTSADPEHNARVEALYAELRASRPDAARARKVAA